MGVVGVSLARNGAREAAMSMYFLDETDDWPEYRVVRDEVQRLETERNEVARELERTEAGCEGGIADKDLKLGIEVLKKRLKDIEEKLSASLTLYR
jgi:seryl-tRNA synthetase